MAQAYKDENGVSTLIASSNVDGFTPVRVYADPVTHRLLVDIAGGSGTVTSVSVVTANGFAGTVANATTTPAITLTTTVTGILSGNGTAISAASTTGSGAVVLANTPTLITPDIGVATGTSLTTTGALRSNTSLILEETGAGTDTITIQAPASIAASYTLTLPIDDGSNGEFLQTNGSGVLAWASASGSSDITIGTTTVTSGTTTRILYDNAGVVGEYTLTGSGTVVAMQTAPTFVTSITSPVANLSATSNQLVLQSAGVTGTLTWTPATTNKTITFPNTTGTVALTSDLTGFVTSVSGTSNRITSTGGTTPVIDISASYVGQASITTLGTIATGVWNGTLVAGQYGGTGVANTGKTITVSGNTVIGSSTDTVTFATGGATSVTLPTTGTLATLAGSETFTNKTLTSPIIQTLPVIAAGTNIVLTVPSSDDTATGDITNAFNSGYTSSAIGDLVILDSSGTWQKTDANTSSIYNGLIGIALEVKASGAALKVLLRGFAYCSTAFPTFTVGGTVFMSETAGAVTQTAPTTTDSATRILGYAVHADKMWFAPSNDWITHT